ncbi:MAG: hypothetical protein HFH72_15705 [Lachnospiraceae bacterium]|nr:hypothetical protein [Lachnospiraceae bacterium]
MEQANLLAVDMGDCFMLYDKGHDGIRMDYGLYSMLIGSIDFGRTAEVFYGYAVRNVAVTARRYLSMADSIKESGIRAERKKLETRKAAGELLSALSEPLGVLLDTGHLDGGQLSVIVRLFVNEFSFYIMSDGFRHNDIDTYSPAVLQDRGLKAHIAALLLGDAGSLSPSLQDAMDTLKITATVTMVDGMPRTVYHIMDTIKLLLIDLQKYLTGDKRAKRCLYCGRMFFPPMRSSTKYCRLPHKDTDRTCDYIMHHTPKDELERAFQKAKREQAKKRDNNNSRTKYGHEFLYGIYDSWLEECKARYAKARHDNDLEAFRKWVDDTKFLRGRLAEIYEQYQRDMDNP